MPRASSTTAAAAALVLCASGVDAASAFSAARRTFRSSLRGGGGAKASCAGVDCSWTQRWSCPGWSSGSKGISFDDASIGFRCCCGQQLLHAAEDCWNSCGKRSGECAWCGHGNACCKKGAPDSPAECKGLTEYFLTTEHHECVAPALPAEAQVAAVFVAIFSRARDATRRATLRDAWRLQSDVAADAVNMTARFAICNHGDADVAALAEEQRVHGDLLLIDCDEGYFKGALTRKVLASMRIFEKSYQRFSLFMKVDDDTFVAWRRLAPFLARRAHANSYVGVPIDIGKPCRNATSRWYEPTSTYAEDAFPPGMGGGSGYVLGRTLVENILHKGIGDAHLLWNEDRAVGVWVRELERSGVPTEHVALRGVDGFWRWNWRQPTENWATWGEYPHLVHHGLEAATIGCLARADSSGDAKQGLRECFATEVGKTYKKLTCYLE